ncbi:hypothetical protein L6164_024643 [Bauhinia variegata]|uniref:Uncharacterized protein n=1 Tax=Bauhinia variegata TaxID=167791 RepID=A0ACB9LYF3_BAUVA|nr:hypothetical protein L6164_024643 [Bauhinia variegata]
MKKQSLRCDVEANFYGWITSHIKIFLLCLRKGKLLRGILLEIDISGVGNCKMQFIRLWAASPIISMLPFLVMVFFNFTIMPEP